MNFRENKYYKYISLNIVVNDEENLKTKFLNRTKTPKELKGCKNGSEIQIQM